MSQQHPRRPAAALWDFDGTLADTEQFWIAAEFELIPSLGGHWSIEHARELVGNSLLDSGAYIANLLGRPDVTPEWVVDQLLSRVVEIVRRGPVPWRPGVLELLASFAKAGIPSALVSASYRVLLEAALSHLPAGTFATSVAGDEVQQGKPHPESYLRAAANMGVNARDCVVFEDSATGAKSGNAAGAVVVAIPNLVEIPHAPRRISVPTLSGLTVDAVAELINAVHLADARDP